MAKYKAKAGFKDLENKHFGFHKVHALLNGAVIDITIPENIPEDVMKTLKEIKDSKPKKENKKAKKKGVK